VTEWATRRRKEDGVPGGDKRPRKAPSARAIARMMTTERDKLSKTVARTVAIVEAAVPGLTKARDLIDRFHGLIRGHDSAGLEAWIADAKAIRRHTPRALLNRQNISARGVRPLCRR
jgi:hypothetical protein